MQLDIDKVKQTKLSIRKKGFDNIQNVPAEKIFNALTIRRQELANKLTERQRLVGKLIARHGFSQKELEDLYGDISKWIKQKAFNEYIQVEKQLLLKFDLNDIKFHTSALLKDFLDELQERIARGEHKQLAFTTVFNIFQRLFQQFMVLVPQVETESEQLQFKAFIETLQTKFKENYQQVEVKDFKTRQEEKKLKKLNLLAETNKK